MENELSIEIYQYLLQMSTGKISPLPAIVDIAHEIKISRNAIYRWANGEISCPRIVAYLKDVTGINFPVKLSAKNIPSAKVILHMC